MFKRSESEQVMAVNDSRGFARFSTCCGPIPKESYIFVSKFIRVTLFKSNGREKMAGLGLQVYRLATAPDSDMRKIVLIVLLVYCIKTCVLINYLPKWRWLVMDIYRAAKQ